MISWYSRAIHVPAYSKYPCLDWSGPMVCMLPGDDSRVIQLIVMKQFTVCIRMCRYDSHGYNMQGNTWRRHQGAMYGTSRRQSFASHHSRARGGGNRRNSSCVVLVMLQQHLAGRVYVKFPFFHC